MAFDSPWQYTNSASGTGDLEVAAASDFNKIGGFCIQESDGGGGATVVIRDGTTTGGTIVCGATVAATANATVVLPDGGVVCKSGIFIDRTAGTSIVSVFWRR